MSLACVSYLTLGGDKCLMQKLTLTQTETHTPHTHTHQLQRQYRWAHLVYSIHSTSLASCFHTSMTTRLTSPHIHYHYSYKLYLRYNCTRLKTVVLTFRTVTRGPVFYAHSSTHEKDLQLHAGHHIHIERVSPMGQSLVAQYPWENGCRFYCVLLTKICLEQSSNTDLILLTAPSIYSEQG